MVLLFRPSAGNITQPYRTEFGGPGKPIHLAVDFGWGNGKQVYAAMPGRLRFDQSSGYGLRGIIDHPDGSTTRYAHLASGSTARQVGWGEQIGVMGNSGSMAEFVHLHFEWVVRGERKNPTPYFTTQPRPGPEPTPEPTPIIESDNMLGSTIYRIVNPAGGLNGSLFMISSTHISNVSEASGVYLASILNVDSVANTSQGSGVPVLISQSNSDILVAALGAPASTLGALALAPAGQKTWRPPTVVAGGLSQAQNDALMGLPAAVDAIPTASEMGATLTGQTSVLLNAGTANKNEILAAIEDIPEPVLGEGTYTIAPTV